MDNLIWHSETTAYKSQKYFTNFFMNKVNYSKFCDLSKPKDKMNKKQGKIFMFFFPVPRSSLMNPMLRIALSCLTELVPHEECFKKKFFS